VPEDGFTEEERDYLRRLAVATQDMREWLKRMNVTPPQDPPKPSWREKLAKIAARPFLKRVQRG
jgi:hypothetical protein